MAVRPTPWSSEDKRTNIAGTYEADFTHTNNAQEWIALVATFKEAAGSPVVPSAPSIGTATAGVQQATVSFIGSASDGGSAITSYTVTSSPGGLTATGAGSPLTVTGLTAGTPYTFTVRATNAIGQGPASTRVQQRHARRARRGMPTSRASTGTPSLVRPP